MEFTFLPKTRVGKWSAAFFVTYIILLILGGWIASIQEHTLEYPTPFNSPLLGTVIYLMFASAIMAGMMGIAAVIQQHERAILVYIAIAVGLFILVGVMILLVGIITGPPNT